MPPFLIPLAMAAGGLASKGYGMYKSQQSEDDLRRRLDALQKTPMARYKATPQVKNMYQQAVTEASAPRGFGGAAESAFRAKLASALRSKYMNALNVGGSSSRAVNAVLSGQETGALTDFAAQGENLARANRGAALSRAMSGASTLQGIEDRNIANDINYRLMLERALGGGIQSQSDYRRATLNSMGNDLITGAISMAPYIGAGKTTTTTTPDAFNEYKGTLMKPGYKIGDATRAYNTSLRSRFGRLGAYSGANNNFLEDPGTYDIMGNDYEPRPYIGRRIGYGR